MTALTQLVVAILAGVVVKALPYVARKVLTWWRNRNREANVAVYIG